VALFIETDESERLFWCPGCRSHHYLDDRWTVTGPADAPSARPSVLVGREPGSRCHLFLERGHIRYLQDSDHDLAGQTVPMEHIRDELVCDG